MSDQCCIDPLGFIKANCPALSRLVTNENAITSAVIEGQAPDEQVPIFTDDADAIAGGLVAGDQYQLDSDNAIGPAATGVIKIVQ